MLTRNQIGERYWLWLAARLLVGAALVAWAASYLGTGSGEKEFKKAQDALKQVHSFRVAYSASLPTQHDQLFWEVDCNRDIVHQQSDFIQTDKNPPSEMKQDETIVVNQLYERSSDGSWSKARFASSRSARWYCGALAQGNDVNLMPPIAAMIRRGVIQEGDKKTVNGVRCREWLITMKGAPSGLEHDTVCLGLRDHLPYELTVDWQHSRTSFSDYNAPLQLDVPDSAVQAANMSVGTNVGTN